MIAWLLEGSWVAPVSMGPIWWVVNRSQVGNNSSIVFSVVGQNHNVLGWPGLSVAFWSLLPYVAHCLVVSNSAVAGRQACRTLDWNQSCHSNAAERRLGCDSGTT